LGDEEIGFPLEVRELRLRGIFQWYPMIEAAFPDKRQNGDDSKFPKDLKIAVKKGLCH